MALEAGTVREVVDQLDLRWPGAADRILDGDGRLRRNLKVFVDGEEAGLDAPLEDGVEVVLLAAVSGG